MEERFGDVFLTARTHGGRGGVDLFGEWVEFWDPPMSEE